MAKLILSLGNSLLGEIPLVKEITTIGRNEDNDIVLENLSASGHHAQVVKTGNRYAVEDLKSTNGTLVNGQKIDRKTLDDDDIILIGKHGLRFIGDVERAEGPTDFEKTVFIRTPSISANLASFPPPQGRTQNSPLSVTFDLDPPAAVGGGGLIKILAVVAAVLAVAVAAYLWSKINH